MSVEYLFGPYTFLREKLIDEGYSSLLRVGLVCKCHH